MEDKMNSENNLPPGDTSQGNPRHGWFTRKIYETEAEKKKDFRMGIGIFFGLNILLILLGSAVAYLLYSQLSGFDPISSSTSNILGAVSCIIQLIPWILNLGLFVYFALTRSQVALGMVAGFGIALAISICLGVIFTAWCMISLGGGIN
jgi:hypothetical protein